MATVTVAATLSRVATLLQDPNNTRWKAAELLGWFNDGQREIVLRKPNASATSRTVALVAGTKQALPADGVELLDIVRNAGGRPISIVDRSNLDSQVPDWHTMTGAKLVQHYVYTAQDPKHFYVYPPNDGTGQVELVYSAAPVNADPQATPPVDGALDEIYQSALVDYIMYRACSKDSEYAADPARAAAFYATFGASVGGKAGNEISTSPNARDRNRAAPAAGALGA